ncbi:hypothetical protein vseg_014862 [Gypsophila vaccaria]
MGASPSKRVKQTLENSAAFTTAVTTTFTDTPHPSSTATLLPYQLHPAVLHLHQSLSLSATCPLINKWAPSPPPRHLVDSAYRHLRLRHRREDDTIDAGEFRELAVEVFATAVVEGAKAAVVRSVPVGVVGIAGVAVVGKVGREVVAAAVGAYALGVVTCVYLSLG